MNKMSLAEAIAKKLKTKKLTLATAESCTGGYISHLITSIAGSSAYFKGAVVAYDNKVKTDLLGVKPSTLKKLGAVSAECAAEMVKGVRKKLQADHAIATTGIAGPTGAVPGKPVGTVYIAVSSGKKTVVERFSFKGTRSQVIKKSADKALQMLFSLL